MYALANLCHSAAELGDTDEALSHLHQLSTMARKARISPVIQLSMQYSALLAVHVGDVQRAESEALEALEYAKQHTAGNGMGGYGGVIFNVRRAQGRGAELIPLLEGLVESEPTLPVWRIGLAGAYYIAEQTDDTSCTGGVVERRPLRTGTDQRRLCRHAVRTGPTRTVCRPRRRVVRVHLLRARTVRRDHELHRSQHLRCERCRSRLPRRPSRPTHHRRCPLPRRDALADRARAVPFATHYRYEWARALSDRGDTDRAHRLLVEVADIAEGRDMHGPDGYVAWSAKLLDRIA